MRFPSHLRTVALKTAAHAGTLFLLVTLALLPAGAALAAKDQAEFSLRWDPAQGGPASAEAALKSLGLKAGDTSRFEVQYFDITTPADAPPGFDAIMRKRIVGSTSQLTYKLRGSRPFPGDTSLKEWHCPLPTPAKRKQEADVAFLGLEQTSKAYSRSCSHSSKRLDITVPAALQPQPNRCRSAMTRIESGKLKIEQWLLPDGSRLIEVSQIGRDSNAASAAFRDQVVKPLIEQQVQPLQRSKSAFGGECG